MLHEIGYQDAGERRPIIYRASIAEMVVPYGDPSPTTHFKNVFDMGEYGVGWLANSLALGCDCLGEIRYFDAVANDQDGEPIDDPERDLHPRGGLRRRAGSTPTSAPGASRCAARGGCVISTIATVGNYEYGYFWYLYTDGTIQYEVKLTGVISAGAVRRASARRTGTLGARACTGPPPALLLRAARHGGRRQRQHRRAGRLASRAGGPDNPTARVGPSAARTTRERRPRGRSTRVTALWRVENRRRRPAG